MTAAITVIALCNRYLRSDKRLTFHRFSLNEYLLDLQILMMILNNALVQQGQYNSIDTSENLKYM